MEPQGYDDDGRWMRRAIDVARLAGPKGEVPVGALVVVDGRVVGEAHNMRETAGDPTAHAEVLALRQAAAAVGSWRLTDCTLYATLEPCPMCVGAAVNARVRRLVYGCADPKAGAVDSLFSIATDPRLNHRIEVVAGVLADEASALLSSFFADLRRARRAAGVDGGRNGATETPGGVAELVEGA